MARDFRALILIDSAAAGPLIPKEIDDHELWVRWPERERPEVLWPVLAINSGKFWRITESDLSTVIPVDGSPYFVNYDKLISRGVPIEIAAQTNNRPLALLTLNSYAFPKRATVLAMSPQYNRITVATELAATTPNPFFVAEARNWDEVALIRKRVGGHVLVLEWRTSVESGLSHLWQIPSETGGMVPVGLRSRIPGQLELTEVLPYGLGSKAFDFAPVSRATSPARWESWRKSSSWLIAGLIVSWTVLILWHAVGISQESVPEWMRRFPVAAVCLFPSTVLSGQIGRVLGPEVGYSLILLAWICCIVATIGLERFFRTDALIWALFCTSIAGLTEPNWTPFGTTLEISPRSLSGVWVGIWFSALLGICATVRTHPKHTWLIRLSMIAFAVLAYTTSPWGSGHPLVPLLPLLAVVIAERWWSPVWIPIAAVMVFGIVGLDRMFTYAPLDRIYSYLDSSSINLWWFSQVLSPSPLTMVLLTVVAACLIGLKFYLRQMKRALRLFGLTHACVIGGLFAFCIVPTVPWLWDFALGVSLFAIPFAHHEAGSLE
jgi:hypothetical protein